MTRERVRFVTCPDVNDLGRVFSLSPWRRPHTQKWVNLPDFPPNSTSLCLFICILCNETRETQVQGAYGRMDPCNCAMIFFAASVASLAFTSNSGRPDRSNTARVPPGSL